ncbi:MAG: response regulator [Opitutales bacterium]|nr:response regulator [Opitutales bacterium]
MACIAKFKVCLMAAILFLPCESLWSEAGTNPEAHPHKHVLVINSYHSGFSWTNSQNKAFEREILQTHPNAQVFTEFMDVKRNGGASFQRSFARMLERKYQDLEMHLVYATDDVALQFAQSYASRLWSKNMPIVASGINNHELLDPLLHPTTRGVAELQGGTETIELALALNPRARQIVIIADSTEVGTEIGDQVEAQARSLTGLPIVRTPAGNKNELLRFIGNYDTKAIFLLALYVVDDEGNYLDPDYLADEIAAHAQGPVYHYNEIYVQAKGPVGGFINDGADQGRATAKIALQILGGTPVVDIPGRVSVPQRWYFNYPALERFGISERQLPEGSTIRHKPTNFITRHPILGTCILLGLGAQTSLILYLLIIIHKRQQATASLRRNEEQLRMLIEHSPLAISISDAKGNILLLNKQYHDTFGYEVSEIKTLEQLRKMLVPDPGMREKLNIQLDEMLKMEEQGLMPEPMEYKALTKFGTIVEVEMRFAMAGGLLFRIIQNVTQRNRVIRELQAAKEAAKAASEAKGRFLANVSHEIRTPMNGIMGMVQLLRETALSKEQRDFLGTIQESCDSLVTVINDILDLSKIEAGHMGLDLAPMDLQSLLKAIVGIARPTAQMHGLKFSSEIDSTLPPAVMGDSNRLHQVLMNLIVNACKFTDKGEVTLRVLVREQDSGGCTLHFEVEDTGIGIPKDMVSRVFEPFIQADNSATRRYGGTGLGLSICRRLVQMMGGNIALKSEPGKGSVFSFDLRFSKMDKPVRVESDREHIDQALSKSFPLKILIADDNIVNQKVAQMMLRKMGYKPETVGNGRDVLERTAHGAFDVIFMDVQMPLLNGIEATRHIRAQCGNDTFPYIIAMTAQSQGNDVEQCMMAGMNAYLNKPIRAQLLKEALIEAFQTLHDNSSNRTKTGDTSG